MLELSSMSSPSPIKEGLVATFVLSARYVSTRNWTPALWTRGDGGAFDDPDIVPSDPRAIAASSALDDAWEAIDYDQERAPHATLRIEVTEARWCAHLEPSMIWDVYAFDYAASLLT